MIKVVVNGFGRIGRTAFKVWFDKHRGAMEVVAVNDIVDAKTLAHLLKFDSNYGVWNHEVSVEDSVEDVKAAPAGSQVGKIMVDGVTVSTYATLDPAQLPWKELGVDVVIESTGKFTASDVAGAHIKAGAKKVVISAPAKETPTVLLGVNENEYKGDAILNNGSCTTNCVAVVARVVEDKFGIKKALMTTVHAYTQDQELQDGPHKDLRRARAAAENIVPTSTGAAISTTEAIPKLKGLFDGVALRVPVKVGSISDFTFLLNKEVTVDEVNKAFKEAASQPQLKGILAVSEAPIVSSDIIGRSESAIVDLPLTQVVGGDLVKVFAWYDNEFGYSNRLIEQVIQVGRNLS